MKKISTPIKISILVLFIIFLLTRYISFIFTDVFETPAFFSGRNMQFSVERISFWPNGDFVGFNSLKSFQHMKKSVLKWDPQAVVIIDDNYMFVSSENIDSGKHDYYYIYKSMPSSSSIYRTGDFGTRYVKDKDDINSYYLDFMIPMHLLCYVGDECPSSFCYGRGEEYEMIEGTTIEDVYEFYADSGYYEVIREDNKVILTETHFKNPPNVQIMQVNYEIDRPVVIEITAEEGALFFACTVDSENID